MSLRRQGYVVIKIPQTSMVGLVPFIVAAVIALIEIFICLEEIIKGNAVFSATTIEFHLTWGLIFSVTVNFIENSLRWQLNRKVFNLFGTINAVLTTFFIVSALYTWLWTNDNAGMSWICKNFLSSAGITVSPQKMERTIYTKGVQLVLNIIISWFLPIECVVSVVDTGISCFRKGKDREVGLKLKTDDRGNILCMIDTKKLC